MKLETVIGLEIHVELSTKTKAFCSCKTNFGVRENTQCCQVCMGLPGSLPVMNKKVLEYAMVLAVALNAKVNEVSGFVRKNYFYPDLPKGYQISQLDKPIASNGYLYAKGRKIRINRIQIEEDAGKLVHEENETRVDFNRAGVPLLEIVTEPDFRTADEARDFLEKLRLILLYTEISKCRMQEGNLRCDVNVSVREEGDVQFNPRCEIKNLNSFSAVIKCLEYEEKRQSFLMKSGIEIKEETRKWDDGKNETVIMRKKETGADYRFFPEPDIPFVYVSEEEIERIRKNMPELPENKGKRYTEEFGLNEYDASVIVKQRRLAELFESAVGCGSNPKETANIIMGSILKILNEEDYEVNFPGEYLDELIRLLDGGMITRGCVECVLREMFKTDKSPKEIVKEKGFTVVGDEEMLRDVVKAVLNENEKSLADYKKGKKNALGYIMGQCMRRTDNKADVKVLGRILKEEAEK